MGILYKLLRKLIKKDNKNGKFYYKYYYFRGLLPANYLCDRFNPLYNDNTKFAEYKKAYECCLNRSQNYICLKKSKINESGFKN